MKRSRSRKRRFRSSERQSRPTKRHRSREKRNIRSRSRSSKMREESRSHPEKHRRHRSRSDRSRFNTFNSNDQRSFRSTSESIIRDLEDRLRRLEKRRHSRSPSGHSTKRSYVYDSDRSPRGSALERSPRGTPPIVTPEGSPRGATTVVNSQVKQTTTPESLDSETLKSMGLDPTESTKWGPVIHKDLAEKWDTSLTYGLDRKTLQVILESISVPENCQKLKAPEVNPEINHILSQNFAMAKKDTVRADHQKQLGLALTLLGQIISKKINNKEEIPETTKLCTVGNILTDLQNKMSISRRITILTLLSKEAKIAADACPMDKYLFGSEFGNKLKEIKALEKQGKDLQPKIASNKAPTIKTRTNHLNRQAPSRRFKRDLLRQKGRFPQEYRQRQPLRKQY